jgi:uncharacterized protein (TIGR03435 family)
MRLTRNRPTPLLISFCAATISVTFAIRIANAAQAAPSSQNTAPPQSTAAAENNTPLNFDAASIKERDGSVPLGVVGIRNLPGRLLDSCATLKTLVFYAYRLTLVTPIEGLPTWASMPCGDSSTKDTYDFQATMPPETTEQESRQMMQTLLAERFKLAAHWEKKTMPIYALIIRPRGFKLKPSDPKNDPPIAPHSLGCPPKDRPCHGMTLGSTSMPVLAGFLSLDVNRPVIDRTGLTGTYYINLEWAGDTPADSSLPSLPTVLREQLGLELKSETGPVDVLVVDHAERPTPN